MANTTNTATAFVMMLTLTAAVHAGSVLFVDDDASPGGDGTTWDTAYRFLQDALAYASNPKNGVLEIRVGQGIYFPDRSENNPNGNGDRHATFELITGVALKGGYAGLGADDPDARDVDLYETILSGDLAGNDGPDFLNNGENTLHILTSTYTDEAPTLSGFTITGANANLQGNNIDNRGAGLFLSHTTLAIEQCRFLANAAICVAAGVWSRQSDSSFVNCIFEDNIVSPGNGGAAIQNVFGSTVTLVNCLFQGNRLGANSTGGGVMFIGGNFGGNQSAALVAESCIFVGNNGSGGGAILNNGFAEFHNCLFVGNQALGDGFGKKSGHGGAIANFGELTITNSTFVANSAVLEGGAIYAGHKTSNTNLDSILSITNCILWGNTGSGNLQDQQIGVADPDVFVNYSCIAGLTGSLGGDGNVGNDPQFVDPNGQDGIPGTMDDDLRLGSGSSCIDAADNTALPQGIDTDLDSNPRFVDDPCIDDTGNGDPPIVDMGSYEFQDGTRDCCPGDLDASGDVGVKDLLILLGAWGPCPPKEDCPADFDDSGDVGVKDLLVLLGAWGPCSEKTNPCGDANSGSCFSANGTPGCSNESCCNAVCEIDPLCCDVEWDEACAAAALKLCSGCGNPNAGSCFEAHGTPFCDDAKCCELVCEQDPICCIFDWDSSCVALAEMICSP